MIIFLAKNPSVSLFYPSIQQDKILLYKKTLVIFFFFSTCYLNIKQKFNLSSKSIYIVNCLYFFLKKKKAHAHYYTQQVNLEIDSKTLKRKTGLKRQCGSTVAFKGCKLSECVGCFGVVMTAVFYQYFAVPRFVIIGYFQPCSDLINYMYDNRCLFPQYLHLYSLFNI